MGNFKAIYLLVQLGKPKRFSTHSEHLSPVMFSDLQEQNPSGELQLVDKDPSSLQLHAENIINKSIKTMDLKIKEACNKFGGTENNYVSN